MASPSPLKDIDDQFCVCSICLDQLKEPKLLPCLHRFCQDCLNTLIKARSDIFRCPECREEIQIPSNGADGFKTDFYMKNLVEYVQIQQSLQSDKILQCYGCSKQLKVTAYCFKCNDFLCKDCHKFHVTNKFLKEHQKHTLSLDDIESKNITIEKLASMRDAPRCHTHPEKMSELLCETCDNLPVCVACMLGEHKGHDLHEVKALAKSKREALAQKLTTLEKFEQKNILSDAEQAKEQLLSNVTKQKENLLKLYEDKVEKTKAKIHDLKERQEKMKHAKQNTEKQIFDRLQIEMEKEIQEVRKKYEEIFKVHRTEISNSVRAQESSVEKELSQLNEKLEHFDRDKEESLESIEIQLNKNLKDIEGVLEFFDNINKRFMNLQVLASTTIASENDWTAVQCIPDLYSAADNLIKDLNKGFPELEPLTDVAANYKQYSFGKPGISQLSKEVEKKVTINETDLFINGVTKSGDGNIVISGCPYGNEGLIIVIDMNGKRIRHKRLNAEKYVPWHACDFLSRNKVATVCAPSTIGVYDVRDGSYIVKNITDVSSSWPKSQHVKCVATNPVKNHILVGGYSSRDVYVFDDQLNYLHILTLPRMIQSLRDLSVSNGHLLVCDEKGKKSYVTTLDKLENNVMCEFMKPDVDGDLRPRSVCTDTSGLVYILWVRGFKEACYLLQYNHDGSQVLTAREVDRNAVVVAAVESSQGEKLVVVTYDTQEVYLYGLLDED